MNTSTSTARPNTSTAHRVALWVLIVLLPLCHAVQKLPQDMHDMALATIDYVYKEKFKLAEDEGKKIIKKYPDHPAGHFFCAVALEAWMNYYETDKREEEFYRYCDMAIEKAEKLLAAEPDNEWAMFFLGGVDGYKGTYESRYEKWITSFRHGWKGVSTLQTLYKKVPYMEDINYGVGMYDYWRSTMTKILWWMPGIENKSEMGIQELFSARKNGIYTTITASANLIFILCNEGRYKGALAIADEMLEKFPGTLKFSWGKAAALFGIGRFEDAENMYRYILSRVESEPYDNHYNAVVCHFWLAKVYLKTKRFTQSIAECNRMGYYNLHEDIKKRLEKYFTEAVKVKDQAKAAECAERDGDGAVEKKFKIQD
jgi:tetratricopeptide (TPR) repeat protein